MEQSHSDKVGWLAFSGFLLFTAVLLAAHQTRALEIGYTPLAALLAVFLCFRYPQVYIAHALFAFMFSAFVRRAAEGALVLDQSYILVAMILVPSVGILQVLSPSRLRKLSLAFVFPLMAILYGVCVGLLHNSFRGLVISTMSWLTPIFFGAYLLTCDVPIARLSNFFLNCFLVLSFFVAVYGIVQFIAPLQWDVDWLTVMQYEGFATSMGTPEPMGIRVFSTLSSPQMSGAVLGFALLASFTVKGRSKFISIPIFAFAFLVTLTRSAWLAASVVMLVFFFYANMLDRLKALSAFLLVGSLAVLAVFATGNRDFSEMLSKRLTSFTDVTQDASYIDRAAGRHEALKLAEHQPFGLGMGYAGDGSKIKFAPGDVGFTTVPLEVGYLGTLFYAVGILSVLFGPALDGLRQAGTRFALAGGILFIIILFVDMDPLNNVLGILFWAPAALLMRMAKGGESSFPQSEVPAYEVVQMRPVAG